MVRRWVETLSRSRLPRSASIVFTDAPSAGFLFDRMVSRRRDRSGHEACHGRHFALQENGAPGRCHPPASGYTVRCMMNIKLGFLALAFALLASACGSDNGAGSPFAPGNNQPVDANDILGDLENGNVDVEDLLESAQELAEGFGAEGFGAEGVDLEDLLESAQELAESFGGSGSGTVEINGDTINFTSEFCFVGQGDFTIEGPGSTDDGTPVWVSIDRTEDSRAELAEFLDEDMLQTIYGDADPIINSSLRVDYGRTELFGNAPDDMPAFDAASSNTGQAEIEFEVNGTEARGSGSAIDFNFVSGDFDERFDFTFQANCS